MTHNKSVSELITMRDRMKDLFIRVLREGEHYGTTPGRKDSMMLYKSGAEVISSLFGLSASYKLNRTELEGEHVSYEVTCTLNTIDEGLIMGEGLGICSTLEKKYRYRYQEKSTGIAVPRDFWETKNITILKDRLKASDIAFNGVKVGFSKGSEGWTITLKKKIENENPADLYNTVLKIARKRAYVDAVQTSLACSDIFSNPEDMEEFEREQAAAKKRALVNDLRNLVRNYKGEKAEAWEHDYIVSQTNGNVSSFENVSVTSLENIYKNLQSRFSEEAQSST
jgi:hypothetical protein